MFDDFFFPCIFGLVFVCLCEKIIGIFSFCVFYISRLFREPQYPPIQNVHHCEGSLLVPFFIPLIYNILNSPSILSYTNMYRIDFLSLKRSKTHQMQNHQGTNTIVFFLVFFFFICVFFVKIIK